jgi:hypothetical protein
LERQIASTEKSDVLLLQKQNKEFDNQINQVNSNIDKINEKFSVEKNNFNNLSGEVLV